jgi:hypothetical protein
MSRTYAIIDTSDLLTRTANESVDGSVDSLRKTVRNTEKSLLRWDGSPPYGTGSLTTYTHEEILSILNDPEGDWWIDVEAYRSYKE